MLRWLGEGVHDGRKQNVITFTDTDGALLTLYFDAQTSRLTKIESVGGDVVLGDVTIEVIYDDWRPVGKLTLPHRFVDRVGGARFLDMRATSVQLDTQLADSLFALPEGFTRLEPPRPGAQKLGEDVYLVPGGYNSIFVVFNDYVLVLESGGGSRAVVNEIKKIAPDKPIRYVVTTHFHFDHAGGARGYLQEGVTFVTSPTAKWAIEKSAAAALRLRPDSQSRTPRTPTVETFREKRVFDDGTHRVELYEFESPHAAEMIVAYLPKEKILLEGDLLDLDIPEGGTAAAGRDTADLLARIEKWGLQVERIVPVHGRLGTMDDLRRAIAAHPPKP